jgi:hypothetical protein
MGSKRTEKTNDIFAKRLGLAAWLILLFKQHLQSARQNSQPSKQIDRSFLSLGNKPFRLKLARCCFY